MLKLSWKCMMIQASAWSTPLSSLTKDVENHGKVIHHRLKCPNKKSHARRQEEARYADPQETITSEHYGIDV
ncbi:hypothetical protein M514_21184 [Trichuris suis]|uniref:Uncharacterized protein n=1 Tax=Trichuris suis TaxID=68888 RepID=A0A085NB21_9BILA|nr:hypothetical protein M514_21184 [Trichuris suis]